MLGCGDSSGDFGDATWDGWLADVELAYQYLRQRSSATIWLWGLRAGCLIAASAAPRLPEKVKFLF
jgi:esterase/lipase